MTPRFDRFAALAPEGFVSIAYSDWGRGDAARAVVCAHGLTRNARDFDVLAAALAVDGYRVVCVDMPGRGASGWLAQPEGYGYPLYVSVAAALLARIGMPEVDWVGTSMGGIIGMMLAAKANTPIRRLVLNDIGPMIPKPALERIAEYVGADPRFDDLAGVEAYLRRVNAAFGPLGDAEWAHLARHSAASDGNGRLKLHYDPAIGAVFKARPIEDVDLWPIWDGIACPTLVLRGANSDLLSSNTLAEMRRRGPAAKGLVQSVEFARCGHAPALMADDQVASVRQFLADR
ncbi:MAG TPA: alpha/beta hydrolase [Alphaproteobacteria bacterium]|nr:alpha/beta hydrolase [Alphaproteobacteria bacterium]